jgi:hypothetical protein
MNRSVVMGAAALAAIGLVTVAASILLPTVIITAYALLVRDALRIGIFAVSVAEPLALVGAAGVAFLGARVTVSWWNSRPQVWGAIVGVIAATWMVAAAIRVQDIDGWTAAAAILLPVVGALGAWWKTRPRSRVLPASESSAQAL